MNAPPREAYAALVVEHDETVRALARAVVERERQETFLRALETEEKTLRARRVEIESQLLVAALEAERAKA